MEPNGREKNLCKKCQKKYECKTASDILLFYIQLDNLDHNQMYAELHAPELNDNVLHCNNVEGNYIRGNTFFWERTNPKMNPC